MHITKGKASLGKPIIKYATAAPGKRRKNEKKIGT
jgi:hypothetical protein